MRAFAKYRKYLAVPLTRAALEKWREKFAADVVKLAEESTGRDEFLQRLHDELAAIGFNFEKLGNGSTRAAFSLPFRLVAKLQVTRLQVFQPFESERPHDRERPSMTANAAELERSKMFPAFIPRVYANLYRTFASNRWEQTIDLLVSEQMVPVAKFFDAITTALGSTSGANLGIDPTSGRLMVLDTGSAWAEGTEEAFLDGTHPLVQFPFMREPRW